jgi:hypothetical protein
VIGTEIAVAPSLRGVVFQETLGRAQAEEGYPIVEVALIVQSSQRSFSMIRNYFLERAGRFGRTGMWIVYNWKTLLEALSEKLLKILLFRTATGYERREAAINIEVSKQQLSVRASEH